MKTKQVKAEWNPLNQSWERTMKQPSKAELRDRIAELEEKLGWKQIYERHEQEAISYNLGKEAAIRELEPQLKRATIAAYALLATLFIIVGVEVIW